MFDKIVLKPTTIVVHSIEELFEKEMNRRLPGFDWRVKGKFNSSWDLVSESQDVQPTEVELNVVRIVADEIFKELGLNPNTDVAWGMPAKER